MYARTSRAAAQAAAWAAACLPPPVCLVMLLRFSTSCLAVLLAAMRTFSPSRSMWRLDNSAIRPDRGATISSKSATRNCQARMALLSSSTHLGSLACFSSQLAPSSTRAFHSIISFKRPRQLAGKWAPAASMVKPSAANAFCSRAHAVLVALLAHPRRRADLFAAAIRPVYVLMWPGVAIFTWCS